jgi:hypothetical protein
MHMDSVTHLERPGASQTSLRQVVLAIILALTIGVPAAAYAERTMIKPAAGGSMLSLRDVRSVSPHLPRIPSTRSSENSGIVLTCRAVIAAS